MHSLLQIASLKEDGKRCPLLLMKSKPVEEVTVVSETRRPIEEDRVDLEAELARLDAERNIRGVKAPEVKVDPHLAALENQLSELDF
jgi:hypothetical protein